MCMSVCVVVCKCIKKSTKNKWPLAQQDIRDNYCTCKWEVGVWFSLFNPKRQDRCVEFKHAASGHTNATQHQIICLTESGTNPLWFCDLVRTAPLPVISHGSATRRKLMFPVQKIGGFSPTKAKKTDSIHRELEASTSDRLKIRAFFFFFAFFVPLLKLLGLQVWTCGFLWD